MKKALVYFFATALLVTSCGEDYNPYGINEVNKISDQNSNDDEAIADFLENNYMDNQGKLQTYTENTSSEFKKLSDMSPIKLPSGVVVIVRPGAQPEPGIAVGETDVLSIIQRSYSYLSTDDKSSVLTGAYPFVNTVDGSGVPDKDPLYYYADPKTLASSEKTREYFEIEGLREGLKHFKSFQKEDHELYNLQGVIIVPSRAAFSRDEHYRYNGVSWRNRTFVFNFQLYNSTPRP